MTMTPTEFHDLMTRALGDRPSAEGVGADVERDIAAGRRLLSRRRRTTGAIVLACLVVLGLAVVEGTGDAGRPDAVDRPRHLSDAAVLRLCRSASLPAAESAVFGGGRPEIMAIARQPNLVAVALESADGASWASCYVEERKGRPWAFLTAYAGKRDPSRVAPPTITAEFTCWPLDPVPADCMTFRAFGADRLPPAVAAVLVRTADGVTTRVPTHRGYFAVTYLGELADATQSGGKYGRQTGLLDSLVYLDRTGTPIAGIRTNRKSPIQPFTVDDLPLIYEYPAVRGESIE